ncbi:MAG: tetratricopeptide repeat protein [Roseiarcus sp.]
MISWIATRLFYAIVFFLLGFWAARDWPGLEMAMRHTTVVATQEFDKLRDWTSTTLSPPVESYKPKTEAAAALPPPPAPAPVAAAAPPPPPAPAPEAAAAPPPAPAPAPQVAAAPPPEPEASVEPSGEGVLTQARIAYAHNDVNAAIEAYREYISRNPDAVDALGELGNVYYAAGRRHEAAEMFLEAGQRRLDTGDVAGAKALLGALRQTDSELADQFARRIATSESGKN